MNRIDAHLLAIFEPEQQEHLAAIRALLPRASAAPMDGAAADELLRRAHTLKGAARAVGITGIEALAHRLESLFARIRERRSGLDAAAESLIGRAMEAVEDSLAAVIQNGKEPDHSTLLLEFDGAPAPPGRDPLPNRDLEEAVAPVEGAVAPIPRSDMVRVTAESVDQLVRSSAQLVAAVSEAAAVSHQLADLNTRLAEIEKTWSRAVLEAAAVLRRPSPELLPVREAFNSLGAQIHRLATDARRSYSAQRRHLWRFEGLSGAVHRQACRARMVPAASVFNGFGRMVRDLAREQAKEIEFHLEGGEVLADRQVLQALKDAVMHLLRNAVGHGIEAAEERLAAGKPRTGSVRLGIESRADRLLVSVEDDGRGIDAERVTEAARRTGLLKPDQPAPGDWHEIAALLLRPGFSTSRSVTTLAGRGMGLCVVRNDVERLDGEVDINPRPGGGATFLLSVPLSVSTHHVLLLRSGGHLFAVSIRGVEGLYRVDPQTIETLEGRETVQVRGLPVPLTPLAALLGISETGRPNSKVEGKQPVRLVVVRAGNERLAVTVDALLDEREVIVRDLGIPAHMAGMSSGGALLEDGRVAVLLDPAGLLHAFNSGGERRAVKPPAEAAGPESRSILVVDDSITTRALEKSILEAHGYKVRVAVDGLDALAQLRAARADLVIADVSMPRMNGFELVEAMKRDRQTASIPVIMVTSMESKDDQERGMALGADAYIIKRKFDQRELLETVGQII